MVVIWGGPDAAVVAITTGLRGWDWNNDPWHEVRVMAGNATTGMIAPILDEFLRPTSLTIAQVHEQHGTA